VSIFESYSGVIGNERIRQSSLIHLLRLQLAWIYTHTSIGHAETATAEIRAETFAKEGQAEEGPPHHTWTKTHLHQG